MAITELYVDPSIAADSGAGTVGDPYGDLEYALEETDWDSTNGIRVSIKAGTDEVLAAELSVAMASTVSASKSIAWSPSQTAPLVFQGYTTAAGDRGVGGISGGGSVAIYTSTTLDFISFVDLHLHNTGANIILTVDDHIRVINCELDNSTAGGILLGEKGLILRNYFHNIGGIGVDSVQSETTFVAFNYFENGTNDFSACIDLIFGIIFRNIIKVDTASTGIRIGTSTVCIGNSLYGAGSSGSGIIVTVADTAAIVLNNIISGFTTGLHMGGTNAGLMFDGGNAFYNNTQDELAAITVDPISLQANESLIADPFTDAANGDFSPVDTGSVKEGAYPQTFYEG